MPRVYKTAPTTHEDALHAAGMRFVAGIDEAGRGPLAGPVAAAAVVFAPGCVIEGVFDSKKIAPGRRVLLAQRIKNEALGYGIAFASPEEIDEINILQATLRAMKSALEACADMMGEKIDYALIDGIMKPALDCPFLTIKKGDALCHSIAAASILAKTARDEIMLNLDKKFPHYGFALHKGYGTKAHLAALHKHGACTAHRQSFAPVNKIV